MQVAQSMPIEVQSKEAGKITEKSAVTSHQLCKHIQSIAEPPSQEGLNKEKIGAFVGVLSSEFNMAVLEYVLSMKLFFFFEPFYMPKKFKIPINI